MIQIVALLAIAASPSGASTIDRSPAGARIVVEHYYAAIERGRYRTAWLAWDRSGAASRQSLASFTRGYAATAHVRVVAGVPRDGEGAAGSVFITVPVQVAAVLKDGRRQAFAGSYVLRRVNDVSGATPAQRVWHLASASLRQVS